MCVFETDPLSYSNSFLFQLNLSWDLISLTREKDREIAGAVSLSLLSHPWTHPSIFSSQFMINPFVFLFFCVCVCVPRQTKCFLVRLWLSSIAPLSETCSLVWLIVFPNYSCFIPFSRSHTHTYTLSFPCSLTPLSVNDCNFLSVLDTPNHYMLQIAAHCRR